MKPTLSESQQRELERLKTVAPEARFVVIGAVALKSHLELPRSTGDVDLAIDLGRPETEALLRTLGWSQRAKMPQRWTRGDFVADVIPSSAALIETGHLSFEEGREMNLAGFELVFRECLRGEVGGLSLEFASLPTILFLKVVAWLDRPHARRKDLNDLGTILRNYLADHDERRWKEPLYDIAFESQAAFLAGFDLGGILGRSHLDLIDLFFERVDEPVWLREIAKGIDSPLLVPEDALRAFREGICCLAGRSA